MTRCMKTVKVHVLDVSLFYTDKLTLVLINYKYHT